MAGVYRKGTPRRRSAQRFHFIKARADVASWAAFSPAWHLSHKRRLFDFLLNSA
jgi:hypothetical protein